MSYSSKEETLEHINNVRKFINFVVFELRKRATVHDKSKMESPEVEIFDEYTPKLAGSTYGGPEYKEFLKGMGPALEHHYAYNRHHPEHFPAGIEGMDLIDIIEMFCDWKAATLRHDDGDMLRSINVNKKRFKMSDQLVSIFQNTLKLVGEEENGGGDKVPSK
jgi:hypothetical protein